MRYGYTWVFMIKRKALPFSENKSQAYNLGGVAAVSSDFAGGGILYYIPLCSNVWDTDCFP